jgi:hypothetical protein
MKNQRESYEQMQQILKDFLIACQKSAPWESSIETLAGAARTMAALSDHEIETAALWEITKRLDAIVEIKDQVQTIISNLPAHTDWPCDGCERWTAIGCNRHTTGGFWE